MEQTQCDFFFCGPTFCSPSLAENAAKNISPRAAVKNKQTKKPATPHYIKSRKHTCLNLRKPLSGT